MNAVISRSLVLLVMVLYAAAPVQAQDALEQEPGYVDFRAIESWFDTEPNIEVNLKGALLELVAEASRESNPELADMLHSLKAIQVRGFTNEDGSQATSLRSRTEALGKDLEDRGWQAAVRVREDDEHVNMYLNEQDGAISGLMVMASESEDATVFVNIVGPLDPAQIGRLGRALDIDPLKDLASGSSSAE